MLDRGFQFSVVLRVGEYHEALILTFDRSSRHSRSIEETFRSIRNKLVQKGCPNPNSVLHLMRLQLDARARQEFENAIDSGCETDESIASDLEGGSSEEQTEGESENDWDSTESGIAEESDSMD